jgi:hypothetical protein
MRVIMLVDVMMGAVLGHAGFEVLGLGKIHTPMRPFPSPGMRSCG